MFSPFVHVSVLSPSGAVAEELWLLHSPLRRAASRACWSTPSGAQLAVHSGSFLPPFDFVARHPSPDFTLLQLKLLIRFKFPVRNSRCELQLHAQPAGKSNQLITAKHVHD